MDPLLDRFHRLLRSMLQESDGSFSFSDDGDEDSDYREAWEELEDFLSGSSGEQRRSRFDSVFEKEHRLPPDELRSDYQLLEVAFGAPFEEVKRSHRRLMMAYHPDRHAGDPRRLKEATETSQKINYSFGRIRAWELAKQG